MSATPHSRPPSTPSSGWRAPPGVESLAVGRNVGALTTDFDWIVDIQVPDEQACKQLLGSDLYLEVTREIAPVTKYEWTARISHLMRGI